MPGPVDAAPLLLAAEMPAWVYNVLMFLKVLVGFSIIIFVHELGHFLAAKWVGVRVLRFAVGFGYRLFGWRRGEGFTFGDRPEYSAEELRDRGYGETDYCFKLLPIGGYVAMLGQDDIDVDEKTGAMKFTDDPRAFPNRPVGRRMLVVSAGVVFNVLFSVLVLAGIFLVGRPVEAPIIGVVMADGPAAGKLFEKDRIVALNDRPVGSFRDVLIETALSNGPVSARVERDGQLLPEEIILQPEMSPQVRLPFIGVLPGSKNILSADWLAPPEAVLEGGDGEPPRDGLVKVLRRGDRITQVNGSPTASEADVTLAVRKAGGAPIVLRVERPGEKSDSPPVEREVTVRGVLVALPVLVPTETRREMLQDADVLGLRRRARVAGVTDGYPAKKAGLLPGDVVVEIESIRNPLYRDILETIRSNPGKPLRFIVERQERMVELSITPRRPFQLFGQSDARIGVEFAPFGETERLVVADVVADSPAAALQMPRGSIITSVDGEPIRSWYDLLARLKASAGRTLEIGFRVGESEGLGQLRVPRSLVDELDLPPSAVIWSLDGQASYSFPQADGGTGSRPFAGSPWAVREYLRSRIGENVVVRYTESPREGQSQAREATFTVREDNIDPWQTRILYLIDGLRFEPQTELLHANGNPVAALMMGYDEVSKTIKYVYLSLQRMLVDRSVGVENVAGPIGIFQAGISQAKESYVDFLYFLAFISVNLAVLNFLPLPVMDGGLMVFLLIEKIKGKPLSLKAQMISTLVGLAAILLIGLLVTLQDIGRLFG